MCVCSYKSDLLISSVCQCRRSVPSISLSLNPSLLVSLSHHRSNSSGEDGTQQETAAFQTSGGCAHIPNCIHCSRPLTTGIDTKAKQGTQTTEATQLIGEFCLKSFAEPLPDCNFSGPPPHPKNERTYCTWVDPDTGVRCQGSVSKPGDLRRHEYTHLKREDR